MIYVNRPFAVTALGMTPGEAESSLREGRSRYLSSLEGFLPDGRPAHLARLPELPGGTAFRCTDLAGYCAGQIREVIDAASERYGRDRVGVVAGTSTSAVNDVEDRLRPFFRKDAPLPCDPDILAVNCIADHLRRSLDLLGPCYTVTTACSSSARALISAARLILGDVCDAVIAVSADTLSRISIGGFDSLGALSCDPCQPFHRERKGINIGEGAGIALVAREALSPDHLLLLGWGASSDAYHVSSPDPTGQGAIRAMGDALRMAGIRPGDLGYVNAHGTGTRLNDAMEGRAVAELCGSRVPVSSTKHLTGHTLGTCGLAECFICALLLGRGVPLPYHDYAPEDFREEFPDLDLICTPGRPLERPFVMSNSFAFGGNNVSLVFGVPDA